MLMRARMRALMRFSTKMDAQHSALQLQALLAKADKMEWRLKH